MSPLKQQGFTPCILSSFGKWTERVRSLHSDQENFRKTSGKSDLVKIGGIFLGKWEKRLWGGCLWEGWTLGKDGHLARMDRMDCIDRKELKATIQPSNPGGSVRHG